MFRIDIAPDKGGPQLFENRDLALDWAIKERMEFTQIVNSLPISDVPELALIRAAWITLEESIRAYPRFVHEGGERLVAPDYIFAIDSIAGQVLFEIARRMGALPFRGALFAADIPVEDIDLTRNETFAGIELYRHRVAKYKSDDPDPIPNEMRFQVREFQNQINDLSERLSRISGGLAAAAAQVSKSSQASDERMSAISAQIDLKAAESENQISNLRAQIDVLGTDSEQAIHSQREIFEAHRSQTVEKIDAWSKAQEEKIQLAAPIRLWNTRSVLHRRAARNLGQISIGVGILGAIATPLVWDEAFRQVRVILANADATARSNQTVPGQAPAPTPTPTPSASSDAKPAIAPASSAARGVKPAAAPATSASSAETVQKAPTIPTALHFEFIFAGIATLFWLTMFFWLMRILVRRYLAEQRLATDASGRAAMTQTYLGLTARGGATEKERPIVLGALFQPVTDGSTGDDGPPATSMASIVAAIVAGKN